jgi:predicted nucleic acid-binding protein
MIILDTNIVSEPTRSRPDPNVTAWIDEQPHDSLFICTPVLAELHFGVQRLPAGSRRNKLQAYVQRLEDDLYLGRVLTLDANAAARYGIVATACETAGRKIDQMDLLIAAIALVHHAVLATRNVAHFSGLGLDIINPFDAR